MSISAAFVLFAVIWFMTLFCILPLRLQSQEEAGDIVPGTPASAPAKLNLKRKIFWVTIVSFLLWVPLCLVISFELVRAADLDFFSSFNE